MVAEETWRRMEAEFNACKGLDTEALEREGSIFPTEEWLSQQIKVWLESSDEAAECRLTKQDIAGLSAHLMGNWKMRFMG